MADFEMAGLEGSAVFMDMRFAGHVEHNGPTYTPMSQLGIGGSLSARMDSARLEGVVGGSTLDTPEGIREHVRSTVYSADSQRWQDVLSAAVPLGVLVAAGSIVYCLSAR